MAKLSNVLSMLVVAGCLRPSMGNTCPAGAKPFYSGGGDAHTIHYAQIFSVTYYSNYKVVKYDPVLGRYKGESWGWPDPDKRGQQLEDLVLYQCGTQKPSAAMAGIEPNARFFSIPPTGITVGWTGVMAFVELVGATEAVDLIDLSYISSPCAQLMEECDSSIHMQSSKTDPVWQQTAAQSPVVFTDSWGTGWSNSSSDVAFEVSTDPGILHRAEWVRFMALFFNEEVLADQIFTTVETDYLAMKVEAQRLRGIGANGWTNPPRVAWVSVNWQGKYLMTTSAFKRDMTEDAGGELVPFPINNPADCTVQTNSDGTGSLFCEATSAGLTAFRNLLQQADVIIDETYVDNHAPMNHTFAEDFGVSASNLPALARNPPTVFRQEGTVSDPRPDGTVGNAWYEHMPREPNQMLADVMMAIWGDDFHTSCTMKYLRRSYGTGHHEQDALGHSDCPMYRASGSHDCSGVHTYDHMVPSCAPTTTTTTMVSTTTSMMPTTHTSTTGSPMVPTTTNLPEDQTSGGVGLAMGPALLMPLAAVLRFL